MGVKPEQLNKVFCYQLKFFTSFFIHFASNQSRKEFIALLPGEGHFNDLKSRTRFSSERKDFTGFDGFP